MGKYFLFPAVIFFLWQYPSISFWSLEISFSFRSKTLSNERQKSPIEKRKRNLKKIFSNFEKRKRKGFHFSRFERRKRNFLNDSPLSRRERERDFIFSRFERRTRNSKYKFCKYEINFRLLRWLGLEHETGRVYSGMITRVNFKAEKPFILNLSEQILNKERKVFTN